MRSKATQFTCTFKVALLSLAVFCLFILLFRSSIFSLSPQLTSETNMSSSNTIVPVSPQETENAGTPSSSACPNSPPLNPPCSKAPPSLANAIIHYATANVTPQQTLNEISVSARVLEKKSPCNFLVFGLGHDSLMWTSLNYGGRTVFLEEDKSWIDQIQQKVPSLESYHVMYDTQVHQAEELMKTGMKEDCQKVSDPRFSRCPLAHKGLPSEVYDIDWDVIMVDAPTGYFDEAPGRMSAIYTAGLIARNKERGQTDVFVHDVDRKVEDMFSKAFLCEGYFKEQEGRIRHFNIPSHRSRLWRPFCPE